jgi:hypothetical protein
MSYIKGESKIPRAAQAKDKFQYIPLGEGGSCKGAQETRENFTRRPESAASGVDNSLFPPSFPAFSNMRLCKEGRINMHLKRPRIWLNDCATPQ